MNRKCYKSSIYKNVQAVDTTLHKPHRDEKHCDVTFKIGTKHIHANRIILSNSCSYFATMFKQNFLEAQQKVITLNGVDENAIELVIHYIYTGEIEITRTNAETLLQTAHMLRLQELFTWCSEFLIKQLDTSNCIGISDFAETYSCEILKKHADQFVRDNILEVMKCEEFLLCSFTRLLNIVAHDSFFVPPEDEEKLYRGIIAWVKFEVLERQPYLSHLLIYVRLPILGSLFISEKVKTDEVIKTDKDCRELMENCETYLDSVRHRPEEKEGIFVISSDNYCAVIDNLQLWPSDWREEPRMPGKPSTIIDIVYLKGLVYVLNKLGKMNSYDPLLNKWTKCQSPINFNQDSRLIVVNGYLFVFGNTIKPTINQSIYFRAQRYSTLTKKWRHFHTLWKQLPSRTGFSLVAFNKTVYIIGGHSTDICTYRWIECFDTASKLCTRMFVHLKCSIDTGAVLHKDMIYIVGGTSCRIVGDIYSTKIRHIDPITNQLNILAGLNVPRSDINLLVHDGRLYAVGGKNNTGEVDTVECYNEVKYEWTVCNNVVMPKHAGKRYVVVPYLGKRTGEERLKLRSCLSRVDLGQLRIKPNLPKSVGDSGNELISSGTVEELGLVDGSYLDVWNE